MNRAVESPVPAGARGPRHRFPTPLALLLRVNLLQAWRRVQSLREQSRLLSSLIVVFIAGYAVLAFWLFRKGLEFVASFPGLGALLIERLMFLLFAFLFVLLLFSNLVISFTNLFKNRETTFLLSLPIRPQAIFRWKFIESALLASWAFLFLIAPLLAAYGLTQHVRWHFYPVTVGLLALFIILPAAAGSWAAVNLARHLDRRMFQVLAVGLTAALLAGAAFWLKAEPVTDEMLETRVLTVLDRVLAKTRFAQFAFLPSYWLSAGVLQWSEGAVTAAGFFALVLLSYSLFFGYLSFTRMGRRFYEAVSAVQSRGSPFWQWTWFQNRRQRRRRLCSSRGIVEKALERLSWIEPDIRALLVKDLRVFWRDTTQWGQTLVLFGLLGAYILNLRHFSQQLTNPFWVHLVSFLNLGACALNLATLTTRFIYPQFSLEGKRLWIVGLAPLGLARVVRAKYWLASISSLVVTLALISLSCYMLKLPSGRILFFALAITVMTFSLNGLAIGLGVLYPNLKEDNPGKIVSGFGGTFCLVLSFLYTVSSVTLLALGSPWSLARGGEPSLGLLGVSWSTFVVLSLLLGWLPFKLGLRRLARFEL
jgi:ABC-2 type transport system permease protein